MNVLLLDGNQNQTVASVRSLGAAGNSVRVGSSESCSKAGFSRWCQGTFVYPNPEEDADSFLRAIISEISKSPGALVLPMTERTTLPLSLHRQEVFAAGGHMVLPAHDVVVRAFDKSEMLRLASSLGIVVPETSEHKSENSADEIIPRLRFPVVLKPRSSFESRDGRVYSTGRPLYARNSREFRTAWGVLRQRCSSSVVQEFIDGTGMGYFALLDRGSLRAEFAHRRIRDVYPTGSGSSLRVSVNPSRAIRDASLKILTALGWHGVAMVEFRVRPDGTPVFMEVNGRFWNSLALAVYSGVDFPALLACMAEKTEAPMAVPGFREGVRCRWLVGDFRHLIAVWKGAPAGFPGRYPGRLSTLLKCFVPVPGTYHDNFTLTDPLPEFGDWLDLIRRLPTKRRKKTIIQENEDATRGYSRT